jgi:hypothetical protein
MHGFKGVGPDGPDIYEVRFQNGSLEWSITMGPDGKTESVDYRAL